MKRTFIRAQGVSLCVMLLMATFGNKARAEEDRIKIFWSSFKKIGLASGVEDKFVKALEKAAASEGMELVDGRTNVLKDCKTKECRFEAAKNAGAQWLLDIEMEVIGDTYMAEFMVFCPSIKVKRKRKSNCEICTFNEARAWFEKELKVLFSQAVKLEKEGAEAPDEKIVDFQEGREIEEATTSKDSFESSTGTDVRIRKRDDRRKTFLKGMGWIFGGVSLLGFIPGAVLVAIDGRGTCSSPGECPEVYDTMTGGIVSLAVGGACLATAVTLYVFGVLKSRKVKDEEQAAAGSKSMFLFPVFSPEKGGTSFGVRGRF